MSAPGGYAARPVARNRWWRLNRRWLALLPLALALAILGASVTLRIVREATVEADQRHVAVDGRLDFATTVYDGPVAMSMELVSQEAGAGSNGYQAPPSGQVWTIQLKFSNVTPSGTRLGTCKPSLVDSQGRRYAPGTGLLGSGPTSINTEGCAPDTGKDATWVKTWSFGVPDSVEIVEFNLWWNPPELAVFPLKAP